MGEEVKDVKRFYISLALSFLNFSIHFLGLYLQWKTYDWRQMTTQRLIIFHISIAECLPNFLWILARFIYLLVLQQRELLYYMYCVHIAFITILYMLMWFLTVDRLVIP